MDHWPRFDGRDGSGHCAFLVQIMYCKTSVPYFAKGNEVGVFQVAAYMFIPKLKVGVVNPILWVLKGFVAAILSN